MSVPHGTAYLLVTCVDPEDIQFRGIRGACDLLASRPEVHHLPWSDNHDPLALAGRGSLRWVVVSGHGAEGTARISDGRGRRLAPADLALASDVDLYLLACHQGRPRLRARWAGETGACVHACEGETKSALSTLFLLALLEYGPRGAGRWFERWREANDLLRPHFPEMRRLYGTHDGDWLAAVDDIKAVADLGPFQDILAVAARRPELLSGLV